MSELRREYEVDGLSIVQALERFEKRNLTDLAKLYAEDELKEALRNFFPFVQAIAPSGVRDLTVPELTASLLGMCWPIDPATKQAPEARFPTESAEWATAFRKSRANAVATAIKHLERLDKKYPKERARSGSRRSIEKPNYNESIKKNLQEFSKHWSLSDLAHRETQIPMTPAEFRALKDHEYENYIDVLYQAAVAIRVQREEARLLRALIKSRESQ